MYLRRDVIIMSWTCPAKILCFAIFGSINHHEKEYIYLQKDGNLFDLPL
jgi:hypothetical protein